MKKSPLLVIIVAALGIAINCQAEAPTSPTWRSYWIPWHDNYTSWDWTHLDQAVATDLADQTGSGKLPANVQKWEFAVCLASDPAKSALEPLQAPVLKEGSPWELIGWTPGNFSTDHLAALGDGTFLCAILADGRRVSNISRVTINHVGESPLKPGIRITPMVLFTPNVDTIAIRLIPAPDWHIHYYDLENPFLCIDGVWTRPGGISFQGQNSELKPGEIYSKVTGFGELYYPSIKPFQQARVQVKFTQDALREEQQAAKNPPKESPPLENDPAKRAKQAAEASPGYLSEVTLVKFDDTDIRTFDTAFPQK